MSDTITYNASIYTRTVTYTNFKGETKSVELSFALDPLQLMQVIATFTPKRSKSANPARRNQVEAITDEQQLKFVRDLASKAAGFASDDGETWETFENFDDTLAGKAFLTKLAASDADRREFTEKVILDPFRAFVAYAKADDSNSPKEIQEFDQMLAQMENIFKMPEREDESLEDRRARLAAELASLEGGNAESSSDQS